MNLKQFKNIGSVVEIYNMVPITELYEYNNKYYILEWYDIIDNIDQYFIYETTLDQLLLYLSGTINHLTMIKNNLDFFLVDDNNDLIDAKLEQVDPKSLPLPESFFHPTFLNSEKLEKLLQYLYKNI